MVKKTTPKSMPKKAATKLAKAIKASVPRFKTKPKGKA